MHRTISGVEVVTIPLDDYADLLDCKRQLGEQELNLKLFEGSLRSRIDRNPEVAFFLTMRFGSMPVRQILSECRKQFGVKQTPSRTAAYRYWQKVRGANRVQKNIAAI